MPRVIDLDEGLLPQAAALLARACRYDRAGEVAREKLFGAAPVPGHAIGVFEDETLLGVAVVAGHWIRLLAVDPERRRRGVGTMLLETCREMARTAGEKRLRTCDQWGNYLTPGIDLED